jgi:hypothetical protein
MDMEKTKKSGRPRKYGEKPESFGMNVTKEGKYKIKILAQILEKPANEAIMQVVEEKLEQLGIQPNKKRITSQELLKLPKEEQSRILREQAKQMAKFYDVIDDNQPLLDY